MGQVEPIAAVWRHGRASEVSTTIVTWLAAMLEQVTPAVNDTLQDIVFAVSSRVKEPGEVDPTLRTTEGIG